MCKARKWFPVFAGLVAAVVATTGCGSSKNNKGSAGAPCGGADNPCGGGDEDGIEGPDGSACTVSTYCASKHCDAGVCVAATHDDGIMNGDETDVDCGGTLPDPAGNRAKRCEIGQGCSSHEDCVDGIGCDVGATDLCLPPSYNDGVQNLDETGIDCGGPTAPDRCPPGQGCEQNSDCDAVHEVTCDRTTNLCVGPSSTDRVQNGTETDVDCGGGEPTNAPRCSWDYKCLVDSDCASNSCWDNLCAAPSCKAQESGQTYGRQTCGLYGASDCCRSLPVTGYPQVNGKTVYLDKYEITTGRMRAFIEAVTAAQGGVPDIKGYMDAHRPARWNAAWGAVLPSAYDTTTQPTVTYTVSDTTLAPSASGALFGFLYPGKDKAGTVVGELGNPQAGPVSIMPGVFETFGGEHFFHEYQDGSLYPADHNLNCANIVNGNAAHGLGTYWLEPSGVVNRQFTQAQADTRALNCTTNAMFAAFCAWDGGQLVTEDVMSYVVGGTTNPPISDTFKVSDTATFRSGACMPTPPSSSCRINAAVGDCGGLNMQKDPAINRCTDLYGYEASRDITLDDSGRIFPPGSVAGDVVQISSADEGWSDLKGNLLESVVKSDDSFSYNGYGIGYVMVTYHRGQLTTARFKEGSMGARCMRLR